MELYLRIAAICGGAALVGWIFSQRWFQVAILFVLLAVFGLGAIASFFAMIASIIHFQILGAIGFLLLTGFLGWIFEVITGSLSRG